MVVQKIPAQQDDRLFGMSEDFERRRSQAADSQFNDVRGNQEHLSPETSYGKFVKGNQPQALNKDSGDYGPVGSRVDLSGKVANCQARLDATQRHMHERSRRLDLAIVRVSDHHEAPVRDRRGDGIRTTSAGG